MIRTAGIDGCRLGWLRVEMLEPGRYDAHVFRTADDLLNDATDFALMAIDIPIGLTEGGSRDCDIAARRLIGPRRSSVFPAPVRAALDALTYEDAALRSRAAHGKSLSRQAFAIIPKIREVDTLLRANPELQARVREVHPEVSFFLMNGARCLEHPKKKADGFAARRRLVELEFPGGYDTVRRQFDRRSVAHDDILDAFAALWSARRTASGRPATIPETPGRDRFGLRMEMLA